MGVVLLSFMLNLAEEDYYNPTLLSTGLDRKDTEGSNQNFVSPAIGVVNSCLFCLYLVSIEYRMITSKKVLLFQKYYQY